MARHDFNLGRAFFISNGNLKYERLISQSIFSAPTGANKQQQFGVVKTLVEDVPQRSHPQ